MAKKKKKKKKSKPKKTAAEQPPKVTPYPTAGPKIADFEEKLDQQLAGDETKRGPGRPRKQQQPEQPGPEGLDTAVVSGVVKMPFELWSISQNVKELALTDQEAAQISGPVKQLLDYYLPQIPPIAYAWIALTVNGFWIMRTRLLLIAAIRESKKQRTPPAGPVNQGPGPTPLTNQKFPSEIKPEKIDG